MKKKKKYLPLYEKWIEKAFMDDQGLCGNLGNDDLLSIFTPLSVDEYPPLMGTKIKFCHWAFDGKSNPGDILSSLAFTPLRQNIVLLLAAMNGKL